MIKKLKVISAGLFQLKGIETEFVKEYSDAIYRVINAARKAGSNVLNIREKAYEAFEIFQKSFGETIFGINRLYPKNIRLFEDEDKELDFRIIKVQVLPTGEALSFKVYSEFDLVIEFPFNKAISYLSEGNFLLKNGSASKEKIYHGVQQVVRHEFRHAADYLLNRSNLESAGFGESSQNYSLKDETEKYTNYYNHPTELKSYAGDVAHDLYYIFGGDIDKFKDTKLLNRELSQHPVWKYILPENKKKFLQRVYSEFQRLADINYLSTKN